MSSTTSLPRTRPDAAPVPKAATLRTVPPAAAVVPTNRTGLGRRRWRRVLTYLALVAAATFALVPILWAVSTSFKSETAVFTDTGWIPDALTFENYRLVIMESSMPTYLGNTLLVAGLTVLSTLVISIFGAYSAARFKFRGKTASLYFILMTSMIPGIAILVPLYALAVKLGLYDSYLALVIVYTAWQIPTVIWMLKGFFESIPTSIEEAGMVDGASRWRIMTQLVFPLARPGVAAAAIISFIYVWNDFLISSTLVSSDERRLVAVGLYNYLSQYGIVWGQLTAAVVLTVLPVICVFALMERRIVSGLSAGAAKG